MLWDDNEVVNQDKDSQPRETFIMGVKTYLLQCVIRKDVTVIVDCHTRNNEFYI